MTMTAAEAQAALAATEELVRSLNAACDHLRILAAGQVSGVALSEDQAAAISDAYEHLAAGHQARLDAVAAAAVTGLGRDVQEPVEAT